MTRCEEHKIRDAIAYLYIIFVARHYRLKEYRKASVCSGPGILKFESCTFAAPN